MSCPLDFDILIFRALGELWFQEGLGRELITSFLVNLEALFWTAVISLGLSYLTVLPVFRESHRP